MQLGAKGVLDLMNSMGGLKSASSFWSPGDRVVYIFPVNGVTETGVPNIPVAFEYGHNVDLGDEYKRSFLPTMSEMNEATLQVTKPDFAYQTSAIFKALLEGEKARKIEAIKRDSPNENAQKIELKNLEDDMAKRYPAVGYLTVKAYSEVAVAKLDVNGNIIGDMNFDYGSVQISKKKLGQLVQRAMEKGAYTPGANYFYVTMQTDNVEKKKAGQVDWMAVTDPTKKLETLHPDFEQKVTALFQQKSPTEETIGAKIYDFKEYDVEEFKNAVANFVNQRTYMLKDHSGNYHEFVRNERNVASLESLGLVADATTIKSLLKTENEEKGIGVTPDAVESNEAQVLDMSEMDLMKAN